MQGPLWGRQRPLRQEQLPVPGLLGAYLPQIPRYSGSPDENIDYFREQVTRNARLLGVTFDKFADFILVHLSPPAAYLFTNSILSAEDIWYQLDRAFHPYHPDVL